MAANTQNSQADIDAQETKEWLDALEGVVTQEGPNGHTS
jgi:pyruvate dehydrogenase E1 component